MGREKVLMEEERENGKGGGYRLVYDCFVKEIVNLLFPFFVFFCFLASLSLLFPLDFSFLYCNASSSSSSSSLTFSLIILLCIVFFLIS